MQFSAQDSHYRAAYPRARYDLVVRGDDVLGRLYVDRAQEAWLVIDIALLPAHQGRGIGTRLLTQLLSEAAAAAKPVRLHVERFNPAQRLYGRLGFRVVADEGVYLLLERNPGLVPKGDRVAGEHAYPNTVS
jgi:ribosomal protein S18 acetylase RimI-like enzyme